MKVMKRVEKCEKRNYACGKCDNVGLMKGRRCKQDMREKSSIEWG